MTSQLPAGDGTPDVDLPEPTWAVTAVVPVKPLARAKSRLVLPDELRRALVLAFAGDTVAALSANPFVAGVVVVTTDPEVEQVLGALASVRLLRDDGTGLCQAVHAGSRAASSWSPGTGVLVVPADLPCLVAADVTAVLVAGRRTDGAFVPDRSGSGTTLLLSHPGRQVVASYGPGSAARHRALGVHPLDDAPPGARLDVDTVADLRSAVTLGLGPQASAVLAGVGSLDAWQRRAS